jgi:hypothetical protein
MQVWFVCLPCLRVLGLCVFLIISSRLSASLHLSAACPPYFCEHPSLSISFCTSLSVTWWKVTFLEPLWGNGSSMEPSLSSSIAKCTDRIVQLDKRLNAVCKAYLITSAEDSTELGAVIDQLERNFLELRAQREREHQKLKALKRYQNAVLADPDLARYTARIDHDRDPGNNQDERRKLVQQVEVLDSLSYQLRQDHPGGANVRGRGLLFPRNGLGGAILHDRMTRITPQKGRDEIFVFLERHGLEQHYDGLSKLGVRRVQDLFDVDRECLDILQMKKLEEKRFFRALEQSQAEQPPQVQERVRTSSLFIPSTQLVQITESKQLCDNLAQVGQDGGAKSVLHIPDSQIVGVVKLPTMEPAFKMTTVRDDGLLSAEEVDEIEARMRQKWAERLALRRGQIEHDDLQDTQDQMQADSSHLEVELESPRIDQMGLEVGIEPRLEDHDGMQDTQDQMQSDSSQDHMGLEVDVEPRFEHHDSMPLTYSESPHTKDVDGCEGSPPSSPPSTGPKMTLRMQTLSSRTFAMEPPPDFEGLAAECPLERGLAKDAGPSAVEMMDLELDEPQDDLLEFGFEDPGPQTLEELQELEHLRQERDELRLQLGLETPKEREPPIQMLPPIHFSVQPVNTQQEEFRLEDSDYPRTMDSDEFEASAESVGDSWGHRKHARFVRYTRLHFILYPSS